MEQSDLLRFLAAALERLGLAYFVTGSIASMYFGEARLTNDIDVGALQIANCKLQKSN